MRHLTVEIQTVRHMKAKVQTTRHSTDRKMKVEEIDNEANENHSQRRTYNMDQGECRRRNISFGTMKQEKLCIYETKTQAREQKTIKFQINGTWTCQLKIIKFKLGVSTDNINDKTLIKYRPNKPYMYMSIMCGSTQNFYLLLYN